MRYHTDSFSRLRICLTNHIDRSSLLPSGPGRDDDIIAKPLVMDSLVLVEGAIEFQEVQFGQDRGERASEGDATFIYPAFSGLWNHGRDDPRDKVKDNVVGKEPLQPAE